DSLRPLSLHPRKSPLGDTWLRSRPPCARPSMAPRTEAAESAGLRSAAPHMEFPYKNRSVLTDSPAQRHDRSSRLARAAPHLGNHPCNQEGLGVRHSPSRAPRATSSKRSCVVDGFSLRSPLRFSWLARTNPTVQASCRCLPAEDSR